MQVGTFRRGEASQALAQKPSLVVETSAIRESEDQIAAILSEVRDDDATVDGSAIFSSACRRPARPPPVP